MSLWDELIKMRDSQREEIDQAPRIIRFENLPWEVNPEGKMRWYLHPALKPAGIRTIMVLVQEIPPGSKGGKMHRQGGWAFLIWEGKGYSIIDDKRYDWETDDMMLLSITAEGVTYQHFNTDPNRPALILAFALDLTHSLTVDQGVGFECLEAAPEFKAG